MCGILFFKGQNLKIEKFDDALGLMQHRGPDNSGTMIHEDVILGHNRLSILDLDKRSNQPFVYGEYVIIFNGEIYNYLELIKTESLELKTTSDTEVLIQLYSRYKEKCLDLLNGMFAFVIYNTKTNEVFAARDRLGIKPMYIFESAGEIIISSEIASILALRDCGFDSFGIRQYTKLRMTIKGHTIYNNIRTFPAGSYYKNKQFKQYWKFEIEEHSTPNDEELFYLINDAINIRQRADVPLGTFLSGGLDSSIITAVAKPKYTWTVGFEILNEFEWSQKVSDDLETVHFALTLPIEQFQKTAKKMVKKRREPLCVPNEVLLYELSKEIKHKNTVILSGEGADELFWGYDRIFRWAYNQQTLTVEGFEEKYCYGSKTDMEVLDFAIENLPGKRVIDKIAYYFQTIHLHGLLRRLDNSSMLCSLEARVPFVDHRLVEHMSGKSFEYRMGNSFKEPLKKLYSDQIREDVIKRPKVGFPVPLEKIFDVSGKEAAWNKWFDFNLEILKANK